MQFLHAALQVTEIICNFAPLFGQKFAQRGSRVALGAGARARFLPGKVHRANALFYKHLKHSNHAS